MEDFIALANKLAGVSFATLLMAILYGSWKGIWVWGREVPKLEGRLREDLQRVEEERDWWRNLAIKATGIAETQGHVLRVREDKELAKIDTVNRRMIE